MPFSLYFMKKQKQMKQKTDTTLLLYAISFSRNRYHRKQILCIHNESKMIYETQILKKKVVEGEEDS